MTDPKFTLEEFLEWARTKSADESYDYVNNLTCPIAQFLNETGRAQRAFVLSETWYDDAIPRKRGKQPTFHLIPKKVIPPARAIGILATFGQLVQRLEVS